MPLTREVIGKPCAGNLHARFERGSQVVGRRVAFFFPIT
jgi:hypothetical protein